MPAYYCSTIEEFLTKDNDSVLGILNSKLANEGFQYHKSRQVKAWRKQLEILKSAFETVAQQNPDSNRWGLLLEYPIPRRQKRLDLLLLARDVIICVEFKTDAKKHTLQARRQVEDYALDLRDFHDVSRGRRIVPIAVSTAADDVEHLLEGICPDLVKPTLITNATGLARTIILSFTTQTDLDSSPIDIEKWNSSSYHPVPTIVEAAEALYAQHNVVELIHSHAGDDNLETTSKTIIQLVKRAQKRGEKIACFVTGIPGAGKTLAGLNIVHNPALRSEGRNPGVFLSGNGPLVNVIRAAIENDFKQRAEEGDARRTSGTFIQNVHTFIKAEKNRDKPHENVIVFDEAQRAWNAEQVSKKIKPDDDEPDEDEARSEPEIILSIMNRPKWAVVVALVGGGQEIHVGEAGLEEWGRALNGSFPHWRVAASPQALEGDSSVAGHKLFQGQNPEAVVCNDRSLHLAVNRRSLRAERVTDWVEAVLKGDSLQAAKIAAGFADFPLLLTRSLQTAREWLRKRTRGLQRCGLVASSGGLRLRAEGLELSSGFRRNNRDLYVHWFLKDSTDVRSSNQLEVAASEFECQGLELDWVGLCWSGDFTFDQTAHKWCHRWFRGNDWLNQQDPVLRQHLVNKYRVLLTRARRGMIIWVPQGDASDTTRPPEWFDATAKFLQESGLPLI